MNWGIAREIDNQFEREHKREMNRHRGFDMER